MKVKQFITDGLEWHNAVHRNCCKDVLMTCCDLSAMAKPYEIAEAITFGLYGKLSTYIVF